MGGECLAGKGLIKADRDDSTFSAFSLVVGSRFASRCSCCEICIAHHAQHTQPTPHSGWMSPRCNAAHAEGPLLSVRVHQVGSNLSINLRRRLHSIRALSFWGCDLHPLCARIPGMHGGQRATHTVSRSANQESSSSLGTSEVTLYRPVRIAPYPNHPDRTQGVEGDVRRFAAVAVKS